MCPQGGALLHDGDVTWIIDDIRDATPIGAVTGRLYLPAGYVKCNGATVQRADYPRLVALADKYSLWTSDTAANLGMFGAGDGSTTMVLPNWSDRMAQFAATAGGTVAAGLPDITGTFQAAQPGASGAFSNGGNNSGVNGNNPAYYTSGTTFYASRCSAIYGKSTTVQPQAINVMAVMRY